MLNKRRKEKQIMVNKGKILVVDDNPGIRAALKILLPKYFAAVELLASPKEIHASLREFAPKSNSAVRRRKWCFLRRMPTLLWRWKA